MRRMIACLVRDRPSRQMALLCEEMIAPREARLERD
jgi:hypothetical protein